MGLLKDVPSPGRNCTKCPRLVEFREANRMKWPDWHNAPVPSFGRRDSRLLVVGLAPGLKGANRTGRPFTGDWAGDLLYPTLKTFGLATGTYGANADDGFELVDCRITNAVRCVPPENKPVAAETSACRSYLEHEITGMPDIQVVLALGTIAHVAVLTALGEKKKPYPFRHGEIYDLAGGPLLADSYHCSRYNTNTGRLTEAMFHDVFRRVLAKIRS